MLGNGERGLKKVGRSGKRVDVTQTRYEGEYQTIKKLQKEGFKVIHLCEALGVSKAGYYKWLKRKPSASEKRLRQLIELIIQAYEKYKGIYGYRRITIYLNHFLNAKVNHKCVYRLMNVLGLKAVIRRKRYSYKPHKPQHVVENTLNRKFQKEYKAMEVLLTDVTEFKYGKSSKAYLSAILDYGANKIVAFKLSTHNNNALVRDTVEQIETDIVPTQTLLHSDRGFQYTSHGFNSFIKRNQIIQSMSRVGKCIDNG
ncbi:IS3 family transposase, partial [Dolosicoccus paucivorans]